MSKDRYKSNTSKDRMNKQGIDDGNTQYYDPTAKDKYKKPIAIKRTDLKLTGATFVKHKSGAFAKVELNNSIIVKANIFLKDDKLQIIWGNMNGKYTDVYFKSTELKDEFNEKLLARYHKEFNQK